MRDEQVSDPTPQFDEVKKEVTDALKKGKAAATASLHDAKDEISTKAMEYASEAKQAVLENAQGLQGDVGARLSVFGGALRAASEHLANSDQRAVSKLVLDAAGGLEKLSGSLKNKSVEEVLEELRAFGRQNTSALVAGSVFAGLALGRLFKTDATPNSPGEEDAAAREDYPAVSDALSSDPNDGWVSEGVRHE